MRLWHLILITFILAVALTIARDQAGRVSLAVFVVGMGEVVLGTTALVLLFRTLADVGHAKGFVAHAEAIAVTTLVLTLASTLMSAWLFLGVLVIRAAASY